MSDATLPPAQQTSSVAPGLPQRLREWLLRLAERPQAQLAAFVATLFTSALLLFTVQPMFAKMALPKLGGSPSVWAVSMCFFQGALLGGYLYAHALCARLTVRQAVFAHVLLMAVTLLALPIGLPLWLGEPPTGDAYLWLMGVLALGVGLPFFAVSANAPLLQAWFARTGHPHAKDPYFLYGASNLGSLLALLAYPILIEPLMGAAAQTRVWSVGFVLLGCMIAASGAVTLWLMARAKPVPLLPLLAAAPSEARVVTNRERMTWVALAALPSGLMVAVTTYVTTDIASAPFLWVVPLALFLLTFVLVFKETSRIPFSLLAVALPVLVLAQLVVPGIGTRMILAVAAFFVAALVCHRQLFLLRPDARNLTSFYLWMSTGGMIGGVFSALIAPQIFTSVFEFQVLLSAALFVLPGVLFGATQTLNVRRIAGMACLALAVLILGMMLGELYGPVGQKAGMFVLIAGISIAILCVRDWPEQRVVFMIGVAAVMLAMPDAMRSVYVERSFFGTVRVVDTADGRHRMMLHGTTLHGARRLTTEEGVPVTAPQPMTYYHPDGAMGRGFGVARLAQGGPDAAVRAGLVGLGTGSLACYARPGDSMRFFEIDPVVVKVAQNPALFDFLSRCTPQAAMIVGDARQTLAKEADASFDYLVIDAFSSDTVPVHLMTVEAIRMYLSKISANGLLALHISNRHMDLPTSVASALADIPEVGAAFVYFSPKKGATGTDKDASPSQVMFIARNEAVLAPIRVWHDAEALPGRRVSAWTDDYSNVLAAVLRQLRK